MTPLRAVWHPPYEGGNDAFTDALFGPVTPRPGIRLLSKPTEEGTLTPGALVVSAVQLAMIALAPKWAVRRWTR
jgi:hypothetical protein